MPVRDKYAQTKTIHDIAGIGLMPDPVSSPAPPSPLPHDDDDLVSFDHVWHWLRPDQSREAFKKWMYRHRIPHRRIGNHIVMSRRQVLALVSPAFAEPAPTAVVTRARAKHGRRTK